MWLVESDTTSDFSGECYEKCCWWRVIQQVMLVESDKTSVVGGE